MTRNPANEQKVKMYILAGLATAIPSVLITPNQDDDRILFGLINKVNDPVEWNQWLDLIFGPQQRKPV